MKIKLNLDLLKYKKGSILELDKLPSKESMYFRKRIKDSKIDNCVELVQEKIRESRRGK